MSRRTNHLSQKLHEYLLDVSVVETDVMRRLRQATAALPNAQMQIGAEQGALLALLVELVGARRCLEVGTFTGYSALVVAMAIPEDGELIACDVSEEWTSVGRPFWEEAGVASKIDLRLAPALETLDSLITDGQGGSFDFVFIDADKAGYIDYFERSLTLVRTGGLIAVDNTLWDGKVVDPDVSDVDTNAIRAFNEKVGRDERVTVSLVPIGDGLTLARKR
jgi:predicted O-methyltransferase YrrM